MLSTLAYADLKAALARIGAKSRLVFAQHTNDRESTHYFVAAGFLLLSGAASLIYQVTWVRLLGLSMGSTSASISTVIAAFFLGMAAGSYMAERVTRNRIHNFTLYITLEALIGLSGLALLPLLLHLDQFMAWLPAAGTSLTLKFFLVIALLSLPTICMGATFPVMAAILVRHHKQVGLRVSQLYAFNTAGAVLGAAASGFILIPAWGLDGAIYTAVAFNALIVCAAAYLNRRLALPPIVLAPTEAFDRQVDTVALGHRSRAVVLLVVTGFVAIATQVGWTKYLAIFTGTTIYGFAAILTIFLAGIASGSWVVRRFLDRIAAPQTWLAISLLLLGTGLLLTQAGLTLIPKLYGAVNHLQFGTLIVFAAKYAIVFVLIFPPTFLFGAIFPLNLKLYCGGVSGVRARIGKAYAINTLASIAGAILAGFWIIPMFSTNVLLTGTALAVLASSLIFLPALPRALPRAMLLAAALLGAVSAIVLPGVDYHELVASVQYRYDEDASNDTSPNIIFLKEGKAGVISVVTYDQKIYKLQNNGLNESQVDPHDPDNALLAETLLGLMPYFLHQRARSSFVVGFGGGVTARALTLTDIESIRVVELEPAVIDAGRALYQDEIPALKDPRVHLSINDARNTLLVEGQKYDVIVSQPSHPWLAGASNVFTEQFWAIVAARLNDGGIFGQWVNLFNMNASTLKSIYKGFFSVFPHGISFANPDTGDLLLFGSQQPVYLDYDQLARRIEDARVRKVLSKYDIRTPDDLLWYVALSRDEALAVSADVEPNTDTNILSEVRLSALVAQPQGDQSPYDFLLNSFTMDLGKFFGSQAKERFYGLARYGLDWNNDMMTERAAARLSEYDIDLARAVEYESLYRKFKYQAASELYARHGSWHHRVHLLQALALVELGRTDEAFQALDRIDDEVHRRSATARILYELAEWKTLAAVEPISGEEQLWQLAALSHRDPLGAGAQIAALVNENTDNITLLRLTVQHYGAKDDAGQMEYWAQRLVYAIDKETDKLVELARNAISEGDLAAASLAVARLQSVNPQAEELPALRNRLIQKSIVSVAAVDGGALP